MNTIIKTYWKYVIPCALLLMLTNCYTIQKANGQQLVVKNHERILKNYTHITSEVIPHSISIDLPVKGNQLLMDSLRDFLVDNSYQSIL